LTKLTRTSRREAASSRRSRGGAGGGLLVPVLAASAAALAAAALYNVAKARRAEEDNPPHGRFIEVDGVRLHYTDTGGDARTAERPALVLLHGNGAMIQDFEASGLTEMAARRYRVVAFDRPGFGHSSRPRDRLWTPQAQAALIAEAIDEIGLVRPIVLGHSWGTLVALALGLDYAQHAGGLVLASGYYYPTARLDVVLASPPALPIVGDAMRYTVSPLLGRAMAPAMFARIFQPHAVTERFAREFPTEMALRPGQIRASAADTAMMVPGAASFQGRYAELHRPVTVLTGTGDRIVDPERQSVRLADELPDAELRLLPDLPHMVHHIDPGALVAAVDSVATRIASAAAPHGSRQAGR